jgi:hypothetical protein
MRIYSNYGTLPNSQPSERLKYIEKESKSTIKLLVKNNDESKKIIVLSPDLEGWILSRAKLNRVSPKNSAFRTTDMDYIAYTTLKKGKIFEIL